MSKRVACTPHAWFGDRASTSVLYVPQRSTAAQYSSGNNLATVWWTCGGMRCKLCGVRTAHCSVEFGGPKQICSGCAVSRVGRVGPRVVPRRAGAAGRRVNREASACGEGGCDA